MPFNKIDVFNSMDSYKKELKKELGRLDATLGDFFFYDDYPVNGSMEPVLVVGEVKPPVLKTLKSGAKARAQGTCFVEGSTLKLSLTKGKMPEVKLKPIFKGIPFDFALVSGDLDAGNAVDTDERFAARLKSIVSRFDKIKGRISDDDRKELRILFGRIEDIKNSDVAAADKILAKLDTRIQAFLKEAPPAEPTKEETNTRKRLAATTARFDKVKGHLMDDERKELRIMFGDAVGAIKADDWSGAYKTLESLDKKMVGFVREALKSSETSAEQREQDFKDSDTGEAIRMIASRIKSEMESLAKLERAITLEAAVLKKLQEAIATVTKPKDIAKKQTQIEASEGRLEDAKQELASSREALLENVKTLKAEKLDKQKAIVAALGTMQARIKALDSMLDDVPIDQARAALAATVKKMAEATEWREAQLKKEAGGGEGHGTSRHGTQTGMDRQARRAATADGVTPEQPDNPTGVTQSVVWNKVKITYTEENGKRVVENREKLAQTLATEISNTQFSGGNASMWASPVLEKEAYDKAMVVGRKLMGYTHYATGDTSSAGMVATNFTSLTVVLDEPTSGPGWGYAVTRKGTAIDPVLATAVLKKFEEGDITLDKLFQNLNVELIEKPNKGGVMMVPRCKVVLTRATETDDWKLKTHYPDHKLEAKHEGWECERGQPKGYVTLRKDDTLKVFDNKVLP